MPRWRRWLGAAFLVLLAVLVLLTVLPLFETDEWWVRLWDYPRLQLAASIVVALVGVTALGPRKGRGFWVAIAAGVAALSWQLWQVARYVPGWPVELKAGEHCGAGRQISLLNANVLLTNTNYGALLHLVRQTNPDVVLLLETGREWEEAVRPLFTAYPYRLSQALPNT